MKEFIRLCGIAACTLLLLTGCSSKYERDDEPGRVENITVAKMQEITMIVRQINRNRKM